MLEYSVLGYLLLLVINGHLMKEWYAVKLIELIIIIGVGGRNTDDFFSD